MRRGKSGESHATPLPTTLPPTHTHHARRVWKQYKEKEAPNMLRETGFMKLQGSSFRNLTEEARRRRKGREGKEGEKKRVR